MTSDMDQFDLIETRSGGSGLKIYRFSTIAMDGKDYTVAALGHLGRSSGALLLNSDGESFTRSSSGLPQLTPFNKIPPGTYQIADKRVLSDDKLTAVLQMHGGTVYKLDPASLGHSLRSKPTDGGKSSLSLSLSSFFSIRVFYLI